MGTKSKRPGLNRLLLFTVVLFGPGFLLYVLSKGDHKFKELPYIGEHTVVSGDTVYYSIPDFDLTTVSGKKISKKDYEGKNLIVTIVQNTCPLECPINLHYFDELIYREFAGHPDRLGDFKIISIVLDRKGNVTDEIGPELERYHSQFNQDIWTLAVGSPNPFYSFKYEGSNFMNMTNDETGNTFINSILLIDREGHIRVGAEAQKQSECREFTNFAKLLDKEQRIKDGK